jgi:dienelactone hydrolase
LIHITSFLIMNRSVPLAARMFRDTDRIDERRPTVLVTGSWLTVKEQMPDVYARRLAERGYTAVTFDFTGFGTSGGDLRQAEIPSRKIDDLITVADIVATSSFVDPERLAHVAICASAQYGLAALARGSRVKRFVSVAGWYHDTPTVAPFYGGAEGVTMRIDAAHKATERFQQTGELEVVPAYDPKNPVAGMSFELDYYADTSRGVVPSWKNEMATISWWHWLTFNGLSAASEVTTPSLFVHSSGCVLPDNVRTVHDCLRGEKHLRWQADGTQTDYYDVPAFVSTAVDAADAFLRGELR